MAHLLPFLVMSPALAADPELALSATVLGQPDGESWEDFGMAVGGGDFDADGFDDLAISENDNVVYIFSGSSDGIATAAAQAVRPQTFTIPAGAFFGEFGGGLAAVDGNGDGYSDLAVGVPMHAPSYVVLYDGGPAGLSVGSEFVLTEPEGETQARFGQELYGAGDTDGDGFEDLVVSDSSWTPVGYHERHYGGLFVYRGGPGGMDSCPELLAVTPPAHGGFSELGPYVAARGDVNGDGYADVGASCGGCDDDESSAIAYWMGGASGFSEPHRLDDENCCNLAMVGDLDGDGFSEIASIGYYEGVKVFYGSPSGPDGSDPQLIPDFTSDLAAAGDLDADGYGDLILGDEYRLSVGIVFGGSDRTDDPDWVELPQCADPYFWGHDLFGTFDTNGDGRPEVVSDDQYAGGVVGSVTVFSPTCTWYADVDGDGYGDPATTNSTCHDPGAGWAPSPDDCDDADPAAQGQLWYPDADADGYGTAEATLSCAEPEGYAALPHDCDDGDASRNPAAEDTTADGIDEDCDGSDGPWSRTAPECPDFEDTWETTDTGDTGSVDTGETGDTGDSTPPEDSSPPDTGDSATLDTGTPDDRGHDERPADGGCGCDSAPGSGLGGLFAAGAVAAVRARRRTLG